MQRNTGKSAPRRSVRNRGKPGRRDGFAPAPSADAASVISDVGGEFLGGWPKVDYLDEGSEFGVHHVTTIQYVMHDDNTKSDVLPGNVPGMESLSTIRSAIEAQFGTLTAFAKTIGWRPGTVIQQFHRGSLSKDLAQVVAKRLKWPLERVFDPTQEAPAATTAALSKKLPLLSEVARAEILPPQLLDMPRDVPVYGTAYGGQGGDFELNGQLIDHARRPPSIASSKTVFCVYVQGDSMAPWRQPGELVYLNPDRPARPGDYVVVELQGKRGEPAPALLKRLVAVSGSSITLEQFNPPDRNIKVERSQVKRIIRVIDWMELLGV